MSPDPVCQRIHGLQPPARANAERTIIYSGKQAMPLDYNNTKSPWYSEAERTFAPVENWTFGGVDTLVVHFRARGGLPGVGGHDHPQCRRHGHLEYDG